MGADSAPAAPPFAAPLAPPAPLAVIAESAIRVILAVDGAAAVNSPGADEAIVERV